MRQSQPSCPAKPNDRAGNLLGTMRSLNPGYRQKPSTELRLDFPSFYLELTVIDALGGQYGGSVAANVWKVFEYLRDTFTGARVVDPANTNNIISDDLTAAERARIKAAGEQALRPADWNQIVL
jgi:hypothetical protein